MENAMTRRKDGCLGDEVMLLTGHDKSFSRYERSSNAHFPHKDIKNHNYNRRAFRLPSPSSYVPLNSVLFFASRPQLRCVADYRVSMKEKRPRTYLYACLVPRR